MMYSRSVKLWLCVACLAYALAAPTPFTLDIIDMAAISRMTPQQLEKLAEGLAAEEIMRTKRSSAQALTSVVTKASSGLQSKVSLLGQASAGAATFISAASSKSGHEHEGYSYEPEHPKVDFWGLKKSILYTLFQAVKAITGGVTILKGQLIKGGGALAATLGKVISSKGDVVSSIGKKIVSSAALSEKKPSHPPVYGPPAHTEYAPPTAYGAPTAPAHYTHTGPSEPSGFSSHKYPAHLDGRGNLNGVHAGVVILTPLAGDGPHEESLQTAHSGHTSLEPPPSIIHSVYSAVKNVFAPAATSYASDEPFLTHQPPPPAQPAPPFRPMSWGAVNSYGEPAAVDTFSDYDPRNPHPPFDYAASKLSKIPPTASIHHKHGLTPEKIQKITKNLKKIEAYMHNNIQRSSEDLHLNTQFGDMLKKGQLSLFPTPVVSDDEIGVLPGDLLPEPSPATTASPPTTSPATTASPPTTPSTTTTTASTTLQPNTTTTEATTSQRRKKDVKYFLRGNKIVQV